jgi:hypothetical protein
MRSIGQWWFSWCVGVVWCGVKRCVAQLEAIYAMPMCKQAENGMK